jgi:hypothetical protein
MPDLSRPHDVTRLIAGELERARREPHAILALTRPGSAVRVPILAQLIAADAELAERAGHSRASGVES